ncbi:MAG: hypothetical protein P4L40_05210 [Terracidiphilus sp.]|nr:hypothetical protein [Terracidiphilus sp.]
MGKGPMSVVSDVESEIPRREVDSDSDDALTSISRRQSSRRDRELHTIRPFSSFLAVCVVGAFSPKFGVCETDVCVITR